MSSNDLAMEHERCHEEAVRLFSTTRKMGGDEFSSHFLEKLNADIEVIFVKIGCFSSG